MTYSSDNTSYAPNHGMNVYYVIWGFFAILVIFLPCLIFPRHRALCFKRIRERRWNVSMDDEDQIGSSMIGGGNFRRRYPRDDPRYHVTKEESESLKREFILEKLQYFTKVSWFQKKCDFIGLLFDLLQLLKLFVLLPL